MHICLEIAFMDLLLFLFTICVSEHFFFSLTVQPKSSQWRPNHRKGRDVACVRIGHIFTRALMMYCPLRLLLLSLMIWRASFLLWRLWLCVGSWQWRACRHIYTTFEVNGEMQNCKCCHCLWHARADRLNSKNAVDDQIVLSTFNRGAEWVLQDLIKSARPVFQLFITFPFTGASFSKSSL